MAKDEGLAKLYSEQIEDMLTRGAARMAEEEELANYKGPQFYISHLNVMNPNSKSTACRIVFNSSAKIFGFSLNDFFAKG